MYTYLKDKVKCTVSIKEKELIFGSTLWSLLHLQWKGLIVTTLLLKIIKRNKVCIKSQYELWPL